MFCIKRYEAMVEVQAEHWQSHQGNQPGIYGEIMISKETYTLQIY